MASAGFSWGRADWVGEWESGVRACGSRRSGEAWLRGSSLPGLLQERGTQNLVRFPWLEEDLKICVLGHGDGRRISVRDRR